MMKKMLMMSAIAAMALGAQASMSYRFQINHIEKYNTGVVPVQIGLSLRDAKKVTESNPTGQTYYDSITIGNAGATIKQGASTTELSKNSLADYIVDGKIDLKRLVDKYTNDERSVIPTITFKTDENATLDVTWDSERGYEVVYTRDLGDSGNVYPTGLTEDQKAQYAENNLKSVLSVSGKELTPIKTTRSGADQIGAMIEIEEVAPIPEPTSGMLVFLGLAGLMLKRKRAA